MNPQMHNDADVYRFFSTVHHQARESREEIRKLARETTQAVSDWAARVADSNFRGEKVLAKLKEGTQVFSIEDEEALVSNLLELEELLADIRCDLVSRENSAVCDEKLYGRDEVAVVGAYKNALTQVNSLMSITQAIRWAVMESVEDYGELDEGPVPITELIEA